MIKVLVVEDMDITREDILGLIDWEQHGFELLPSARNGKIGLEYALRYRPDIILTDIKMPIMTGLDMMQEVRERIPGTRFILLTAYEEFEYAKRALKMETQAFILKYEIDSQTLLRELNKCVEAIKKERCVEDITTRARLDRLLTKGGDGAQEIQSAGAVGGEVKGSRDIPAAKKAGEELLQYRIFHKGGCILEKKPQEGTDEQKQQIIQGLEEIGEAVRREDYGNARSSIETLYSRKIAQAGSIDLLKRVTVKLSYYFRQKGYEVRLQEFDEWLDRVCFNMLTESVDHTAERFGYLLDILQEHTDRRYSRKVREAMAYIREHYAEDVGLNETAAFLDVSPIYLSHLFKKEVDITFSAYITRLRIEKAKELLRQGDKKIYEISELVGYQTVQYFTKVFKRETGKTPGEFE